MSRASQKTTANVNSFDVRNSFNARVSGSENTSFPPEIGLLRQTASDFQSQSQFRFRSTLLAFKRPSIEPEKSLPVGGRLSGLAIVIRSTVIVVGIMSGLLVIYSFNC